jgi:hypothetical protein
MYTGPLKLTFDKWSMVSIHGLNSLFALLEIILLRTSIPPYIHLGCLCLILSLYLALIYISYAMAHFYPYEWYDPRAGWKNIFEHVVGYAATIVIVFHVVLALIWIRRRLTEHRGPHRVCRDQESGIDLDKAQESETGAGTEKAVVRVQSIGLAFPEAAHHMSKENAMVQVNEMTRESGSRPSSP